MSASQRPVLLTSLASSALLDGRGDLELVREARGAPFDWGGVYGQLIRLTGPWQLSLRAGESVGELPTTLVDAEEGPGFWRSHHRWGEVRIEQLVAAVPDPPGAIRTLRFSSTGSTPTDVTVESRWSPFLLPVLIEGIRPIFYQAEVQGSSLHVHQREFGLYFRSDVPPKAFHFNQSSWAGVSLDGPLERVTSEHEVRVLPGSETGMVFLVHGGLERDLSRSTLIEATLQNPASAVEGVGATDTSWFARTPELRFPDAPQLERAYALARASLRRLYTAPGDELCGLVAGFPWYSSIWCRDLAWMLPAVLWLGDSDWVERSLTSVFRFQSHTDLPILGGGRGELPMQISPGPIFLYGTSDTTLYYPGLVERFVLHSGRAAPARSWSGALQEILAWGEARSAAETGLLRHGGEAQSIGSVSTSLAQVQYGIEAPDTTIWDSTDRRDHAIDVQVLWAEALRAGARLLGNGASDPRSTRWAAMATEVQETVRRTYPWPEESYLADSIRADRPVHKLRPNALRAVSAGWLDPPFARSVVQRAAQDDLTTEWGVRSLSSRDPSYDPQAYHDGQVWTIATTWAADAAFAAGEMALGHAYMNTIARRMDEERFANECYRGDRPEPFNSCFLLGLSVAPFLSLLFERVWGLSVDATQPRLEVRPNFPEGWRSASLTRLSIGTGRADLDWTPDKLTVHWSGPASLRLVTRHGETVMTAGTQRDLPLR